MQPKLSEATIELFPFVQVDGQWTFSDETIRGLFQKLNDDGTFKYVFYDGSVTTAEELIVLLKNPVNVPVFILVDGYVRAIAWLNSLGDIQATAHFCVFKEAWGTHSIAMGIKALDYWFSFKRDDGAPRFELILGVTPAHYARAIKYIQAIGFTLIGEVPLILYDAYAKRRMPAILSYCLRR